jgi:hypothetical protein
MKAGIRPICRGIDVAMLYWIVMNVFDVAVNIFMILNQVLPITPLPYGSFTFG